MLLIHVSGGRALVWEGQGASSLHQPPGRPVGSLPRQPRQNGRLGLPLSLLPEEARLLAEQGLALLVLAPGDEGLPGGVQGPQDPEQGLRSTHAEQRLRALSDRRAVLQALHVRIQQGRDSKRRDRGSGDRPAPRAELEQEGEHSADPASLKELSELGQTFSFPLESCLVQLHTACPRARPLRLLDWRLACPDWPYPDLPSHHLRYAVFRDLRERGYHLTAGGKFGGDFLVYPGDPMRFHAHYIALCVPYDRELPLHETVTAGRLGSNVRKTVLLCSETEGGRVVYTSLRWSGIQ